MELRSAGLGKHLSPILARISRHLTVEARNRPAMTAVRLLAVLKVGVKYARIMQEMPRRAPRALY